MDAVLRLPWPLEDVHFSNSYMDLLENLLSANAFFAVPTLHMLVLNLTYRASTGCHTHKDPTPRLFQPLLTHRPFKYPPTLRTCRWMHLGPEAPGAARQPGSLSETELTSMYRRVHQMLYTVTRIVPSALRVLMNLIRELFPHRRSGHDHPHATVHAARLTSRVVFCFCRQSTREHVVYLRNLFLLLEYAPDLRGDVLATVIDRLLQIDVRHPCALRPVSCVRPPIQLVCVLHLCGRDSWSCKTRTWRWPRATMAQRQTTTMPTSSSCSTSNSRCARPLLPTSPFPNPPSFMC